MTKPQSIRVGFALGTEPAKPPVPRDPEMPFRILLLGNFRGRTSRSPLGPSRRPIFIDRDNIDTVLNQFGATVHLPSGAPDQPPLTIRFTDLDSFHPDSLFERLEVFAALRDLHERLANPRTFAAAAAEMQSWAAPQPARPTPEPVEKQTPAVNLAKLAPDNLLDNILASTTQQQERPAAPAALTDWQSYLQSTVGPYLVPNIELEQEELLTQVDAAVSRQMRDILHHPDFQELEAAWRSVDFLTRRLDTDSNLKVYLLDLTGDEMAADLATDDPGSSYLYQLLVEQSVHTPGGQPWAVLAGNFTFQKTTTDADLLACLAQVAAQAGAPFLAGAESQVLGCPDLAAEPDPRSWQLSGTAAEETAWQELRRLPAAAYLGLALPRFLLRLPYGADATPTERFRFEEMPDGLPPHAAYLWGNPAFLCVLLLGEAFSRQGWDMRAGDVREVDGLPLHIYREDGESAVKPCAEVLLTDSAVEAILDQGLIPVASVMNQDRICLGKLQSLAATVLAGPW
jgi:type VI secretion system protein ImpC